MSDINDTENRVKCTVTVPDCIKAGDLFQISLTVDAPFKCDLYVVPGDNTALPDGTGFKADGHTELKLRALALAGGSETLSVYMENQLLCECEVIISGPGFYAGDNHTHSSFSDYPFIIDGVKHRGFGEHPVSMAEHAAVSRTRGMDWIYTTDHNSVMGATEEKDRINRLYNGTFINLIGCENTAWWYSDYPKAKITGHFNSYGTEKLYIDGDYINKTHTDLINAVKADGGYVYCNHPFEAPFETRISQLLTTFNFRGYEIINSSPDRHNLMAVEFWDAMNAVGKAKYFGTGNSDSHRAQNTANVYVKGYLPFLSAENIDNLLGKTGNFYASNGIDVRFEMDGAQMGEELAVTGERNALCRIGAHSLSGTLTSVILYRIRITGDVSGGITKEAVYQEELSARNTGLFEAAVSIPVSGNSFYRLEAKGTAALNAAGEKSVAYSNPIWVRTAEKDGARGVTSVGCKDGRVESNWLHSYIICNDFNVSKPDIKVSDGAAYSCAYTPPEGCRAGMLLVTVTAQDGMTRTYTFFVLSK